MQEKALILPEMIWPEAKEALSQAKAALIPVGSFEQHGTEKLLILNGHESHRPCTWPHILYAMKRSLLTSTKATLTGTWAKALVSPTPIRLTR